MRVNRWFLYAGVFLITIGGVTVAAEAGALGTATLTDILRLWPLAVIALGAGLVLKRSRYSLPGGLAAVLVPGLVAGSAFAILPRFVGDCGARSEPVAVATERGAFVGPASVSVRTGCGGLNLRTAPGNGWQLDAGNSLGRAPSVEASGESLAIRSTAGHGWDALGGGRDRWDLALPAGEIEALTLVANANRSHLDLAGARIGALAVTGNAAEVVVDATSASVAELSAVMNTGLLSIHLPAASSLAGSIRLGGGQVQVCAPPGVGVLITTRGFGRQIVVDGVDQDGSSWQSSNYESAALRADLDVRVSFGTIDINPIGGCR